MAWTEHDYPDVDALTIAVSACLRMDCEAAMRAGDTALFALAGGKTPFPIYRRFASAEGIDWSRVVALPGDDRCVGREHPASNAAGLRAAFAAAHGLRFESLIADDGAPDTSLAHARAILAPLHDRAFDAVVLGMGEDAHTASLFPGADVLPAAMAIDSTEDAFLLLPNPLPPEAPFPRITLGLARLLRARSLHLIVTGARKREVLRTAQSAHNPLHAPISALLHASNAIVHVHWSP